MAATLRVRDQHIAVFGESGSGKTVLLSSFYGAVQEREFVTQSPFYMVADDTGQGTCLRQNYLGMKNSAKAPEATRFAATPYSFTIKVKEELDTPKTTKERRFDALRLVRHDYPGEWFQEEPSSEEERTRRIGTFRSLLRSDVALVLIDGQRLLDHAGEEEKYLKSVLWGLRDGLLQLKDDLIDDGKALAEFPRIWMVALSKADLHPRLDVHAFQDLVIEKAAGELDSLREVLRSLVQRPDALSIGEDYLRLSSARFEPDAIEVTERLALDLLLPVASVLPIERLIQWAQRLELPRKWLERLIDNADVLLPLLVSADRFGGLIDPVPKVGPWLRRFALPALIAAATMGSGKVKEINEEARANQDHLAAILTQFRLDLDQGVKDGNLVMSLK